MSQEQPEPDVVLDEDEVAPLVRELVEALNVDPEETAPYVDGRGTVTTPQVDPKEPT